MVHRCSGRTATRGGQAAPSSPTVNRRGRSELEGAVDTGGEGCFKAPQRIPPKTRSLPRSSISETWMGARGLPRPFPPGQRAAGRGRRPTARLCGVGSAQGATPSLSLRPPPHLLPVDRPALRPQREVRSLRRGATAAGPQRFARTQPARPGALAPGLTKPEEARAAGRTTSRPRRPAPPARLPRDPSRAAPAARPSRDAHAGPLPADSSPPSCPRLSLRPSKWPPGRRQSAWNVGHQ